MLRELDITKTLIELSYLLTQCIVLVLSTFRGRLNVMYIEHNFAASVHTILDLLMFKH